MRYFKDPNVLREAGRTGEFVDPAGDAETIMTELILADLQTLEKQLPSSRRRPSAIASSRPSWRLPSDSWHG